MNCGVGNVNFDLSLSVVFHILNFDLSLSVVFHILNEE